MAQIVCIAACVLAGVSAFLLAPLAIERVTRLQTDRQRGGQAFSRSLLRICESVGHRPLVIRTCNIPGLNTIARISEKVFTDRGYTLSIYGSFVASFFILLALCALGVIVSSSALGAIVGIVIFALGLATLSRTSERKRAKEMASQMPEVLRTLSAALAAGRSLPQAISSVGTYVSEPMASEFLRASFEIESGVSIGEAISRLCDRIETPGVELLGTALQVSQRTGSSLSDLLSRTSRMVLDGANLRRELEVKTAQARLSARVVVIVPLILICLLTLISPEYRAGVATPIGRACLCVSVLLDLAALVIVRLLMKRSLQ